MAFAFVWNWYNTSGSTWTAFTAGNLLGFYGSTTYGSKVLVAAYNQGMHLRTSGAVDTDACAANHMTGLQYIAGTTVKVNGGSTVNLNTVTQQQSVKINFTDGATSVSTENGKFFAYDASTDATPPVGVTPQAAEQGASSWTNAAGSGSAVSLAAQGSAVSHDFYVMMSASPTSVGEKTSFAWKITIDYY